MKQILIIILSTLIGFGLGKFGFSIGDRKVNLKTETKIDTVEVVKYVDKFGKLHARVEDRAVATLKEAPITENFKTYAIDTLAPALKIAADKITELTRVNAKLQGELVASRKTTDEYGNIAREFQGKYFKAVSTNDSLRYEYNAILDIVAYSKREWALGKEKKFIDISSPDPNFKVNGVQRFKKELTEFKTQFQACFELGSMIAPRYGYIYSGIKFRYNPDGVVSPSLSTGVWKVAGLKQEPYIKIQTDINLRKW